MNRNQFLIIFLIFLVGLQAQVLKAQSSYELAEQDSMALVAFYNATDGPNWISNQEGFGFDDLSTEWQGTYDGSFNKWFDGPVKDWFGVRVEKRQVPNSTDSIDRVTWLWPVIGRRTDGQNMLKGYVPREVGLFTALEQFRVNGNNGFTWSELPDELYHPTLQHLDIESAWFGGEISDAFRNCTDIRKMNFRYNYIDYMPTLDFLDAEGLYNLGGTQWMYSTRLSFAIAEKTIDHFYTVSPNPKEFGVEYRDLFDVGTEQEIVAAIGAPVEMECTSAGEREEDITYQWFKNGLSLFGKTARTLTIASVKESDYADYTVKITNEYVKAYDANSNYGEVFTKPYHLVKEPVSPVMEWAHSSYNGKEITLRFTKPMDPSAGGFGGFVIQAGERELSAISARIEGRLDRDYVLTLDEPIVHSDSVIIDFSGTGVVDANGGILEAFSDSSVVNLVREEPTLVSAATTRDGNGIEVHFDKYIDPLSIEPGDFTVSRTGNGEISSAYLLPGPLDDHISNTVLLNLAEPVSDSTEVLSVSYTEGELAGYLSGVVKSSSAIDVSNQVSLELTEVLFIFEDGSNSHNNILLDASWRIDPVQMYDDGTHGDTLAGDNNWATLISLVSDSYSWNVFSRITLTSYDTTSVTDPETGIITLEITPFDLNVDSSLSASVILDFQVENDLVTGKTSFGINNLPVTFNLSLGYDSDDVFLMGINEDWGVGVPMIPAGEAGTYTATIPGYTLGDLIKYNYRDGNSWENQSVEPRSYLVAEGENILNDHFGEFPTSFREDPFEKVLLYPNPAQGFLYISGLKAFEMLEIYNSSGQLFGQSNIDGVGKLQIDISYLQSGVYIIKLVAGSSQDTYLKFIKY